VSRLLKEADERAEAILREHRDVLDRVTDRLREQEMMDGEEVYRLAGLQVPSGTPDGIAERVAAAWTRPLPADREELRSEPPA
jgi:hypothetical protein